MDDEIFNIEAIKLILEHRFNISDIERICEIAMNGKEAVQKVKNNISKNNNQFCNYDLILMDCNMPILDGYESTNQIRTYIHSKKLVQPIIIAVTGHIEDSYV